MRPRKYEKKAWVSFCQTGPGERLSHCDSKGAAKKRRAGSAPGSVGTAEGTGSRIQGQDTPGGSTCSMNHRCRFMSLTRKELKHWGRDQKLDGEMGEGCELRQKRVRE